MDESDGFSEGTAVRIFYRLFLEYEIPHSLGVGLAKKNRDVLGNEEQWEGVCDSLTLKLEELLEPLGYQIGFDRKVGGRSPTPSATPRVNERLTALPGFA